MTSPAIVSPADMRHPKATSRTWLQPNCIDQAAAKFKADPTIRKKAY